MPSFAAKRRLPQSALTRSTDGASDRVEHAPRPHPTLDWAGAVPYRDRKGRLAVHSRQIIRLS